MSRKFTADRLRKKGFLPRAEAAAHLRSLANQIDNGSSVYFIRSPDKDPDLWVKVDIRALNYEHPKPE